MKWKRSIGSVSAFVGVGGEKISSTELAGVLHHRMRRKARKIR
jgi:hypothetical protein